MARMPQNSLAVVVLNLLDERAMHPYEMQQTIRERHLDHVLKLNSGSLYHVVDRLAAAGLIEPLETQREGRRPERTVYAITESGRDEFRAWLRQLVTQPVNEYPRFAAALAFLAHLDPVEAMVLLQHRTLALEAEIAAADAIAHGVRGQGVPRLFLLEDEYVQIMRRAELGWLHRLILEIKDGSLEGMADWLASHRHARPSDGAPQDRNGEGAVT